MVTKKNESKELSNNELMTAILSYLGFLVLIPLLVISNKEKTEFIKFHLEQGLNIFLLEIILSFISAILTKLTFGIFGIIFAIIWCFFVVVIIVSIVKATQKEKWEIPVIKDLKMIKL